MAVKSKKKKLKAKQIVKDDSSSEDQEDDVELTSSFNNDDTVLVEAMTDDEYDADQVDPAAHLKLLDSIKSLDAKKTDKKSIRGIPLAPTNLDLVVHAKMESSKVTAEDVELKVNVHKEQLKKPLSSGELELKKREIARESMTAEVSKWDSVVQENRLAPQINFAQREHGISLYKSLKPKQFIPRSDLEKELYAALGKSEDILNPKKELTVAEEKALKSMSIQEARARRAELMKHHELLNRMEIKAKRLKRIKSKKYRKILRREREATEKKELEQLQQTDPEAFMERIETLEKARMEERLTLKHRGGGKYSRLHKAYSKFDDKTRASIQDMLQKSKELTQKREDADSSSDEEEVLLSEKSPADQQSETSAPSQNLEQKLKAISKKAGGWLDGPTKFANSNTEDEGKAEENSKSDVKVTEGDLVKDYGKDVDNDADGDEMEAETEADKDVVNVGSETGDKDCVEVEISKTDNKGKKRKVTDTDHSESEEKLDSSSLAEQNESTTSAAVSEAPKKKKRRKKKKRESNVDNVDSKTDEKTCVSKTDRKGKKRKVTETEKTESEEKLDSGSLAEQNESTTSAAVSEEPKKKKRKKKKKKQSEENVSDAVLKPAVEKTLVSVEDEDSEGGEGDSNLKVTMEELFADEDFVEEFTRDKEAMEEKNRPKADDLKLPGWGSWAGPDYKEERKKEVKKKKVVKVKKKPTVAPYVWLNPNRDENIRKLQPKKVPFPYTSVDQYQASLRQPVSRGLVPETATKLLTKPAIVTKQGVIIKAMDKDDYFGENAVITVDEDDKNFGGEKNKAAVKPALSNKVKLSEKLRQNKEGASGKKSWVKSNSKSGGNRSNKFGVNRNNKPGVKSNKSGVKTNKSGVKTNKSGVKTNKSVVKTNKSGVKTNKSGVKTNKPRVRRNKPGVKSDKPGVKTDKSGVKSNKPGLKKAGSKQQNKRRSIS